MKLFKLLLWPWKRIWMKCEFPMTRVPADWREASAQINQHVAGQFFLAQRAGNAETEFGAIALRVQPADATITIDGEPWQGAQDQDPLEVQLGPGVHTVEIRKDGYRTYITDITVRPGETTPLNVSLTRQ